MEIETVRDNNYVLNILNIIRSDSPSKEKLEELSDFHENDLAEAFLTLTEEERLRMYKHASKEFIADIFSYIDEEEVKKYLGELPKEDVARILSLMDSDDAADIIDEIDDLTQRDSIVALMDDESSRDVKLILSYEDDELGSLMTTNFIKINKNLTIKGAMGELVRQAGENDNISILYVVDDEDEFYGAIDLKDLIVSRENDKLEDIITTSFPHVSGRAKISESIEDIRSYEEDSIPVLSRDGRILGVIPHTNIIEAVDNELGDDYAKLAGLSEEEEFQENIGESVKTRLPWLVALMFLGLIVSSVVGLFEKVMALVPLVVAFQSLILGMAGNVGTQSLAVTICMIRDKEVEKKQLKRLVFKELRVGLCNGLVLGMASFIFISSFVRFFKHQDILISILIGGCVGASLVIAMLISSLVGTITPLLFNKIGIDPAAASGPLITTINDLVAVVTYYGLVWVLIINVFSINELL